MLRIDVEDGSGTTVLRVGGRLVGPWAEELGRVIAATLLREVDVVVDLAGVTWVDATGAAVLGRAVLQHVRIRGPSALVQGLLGGADRDAARGLLAGDEASFALLVDRHHASAVRLARCFVADEALASRAATVAWRALLDQLPAWTGLPSLRALLLRATCDAARTLACRQAAQAARPERPATDPREPPPGGDGPPVAGTGEGTEPVLVEAVREALDHLPPMPRAVLTLRDVACCDADETCHALGVTERVERALLHQARLAVHDAVAGSLSAAA